MASHTKLKFRTPQQQPNAQLAAEARTGDALAKRDLKKELEAAERRSVNKKRKAQGLAPLKDDVDDDDEEEEEKKKPVGAIEGGEGEEAKRRRLLQEAAEEEDDDDDDDDDDEPKAKGAKAGSDAGSNSDSDSSDDDDDDDEEDDTAALMRELEKIKRERAEEKERQERERAQVEESNREDEIALGNPLLNLENAMAGRAASSANGGQADFGVKRRWDDDVIFKNQAANDGGDKSGFINDLTREYPFSNLFSDSTTDIASLSPLQARNSTNASFIAMFDSLKIFYTLVISFISILEMEW